MAMEPEIGSWILTADGQPLGRIKRIGDGVFLLDVPGEPDYWLRRDEVETVGEEMVRTVHMRFAASEVDEHRIKYGE